MSNLNSSIELVEDLNETLFTCGIVLPSDEYKTTFSNFPGSNCTPSRKLHGSFYSTLSYYSNGKKYGEISVRKCNENGFLEAECDDLADIIGQKLDGILVMETRHPTNVPLDMYMFHTHRKTGIYVSYPIATFMGNRIGQTGHLQQMENTLFWPGLISNKHSESCVTVMNPYSVNMSYQFSIYLQSGERIQSGVFKTKSLSYSTYHMDEVFPVIKELPLQDGKISLCISGQYKLVCYFMIRNRITGTYSTIDHFHTYCLV
jgi:hypothetical protein